MRQVSWRSSSRGRRLAAAMAAGMALPLMVASLSARADIPLPHPGGITINVGGLPVSLPPTLANISPSPCPSASSLPALPSPSVGPILPTSCPTQPVPTVSGVPTVSSTPGLNTGGSHDGPGTGGTGPGTGTGTGTGTGPSNGGPSPAPPSSTPLPGASSAVGNASFGGVLGLLVAPANVGIENPVLRHFTLESPAPAHVAFSGAAGPTPPTFSAFSLGSFQVPGKVLAGVLVPSLLITLVLLLGRRVVAQRFRKLVDITAVPFGSAAAISVLLLVPKLAPSATADLAAPAAVSTSAPAVVQAVHKVSAGSPAWQQLIDIENSVASLQARLQSATTVSPSSAQDDPTLHPTRLVGSGGTSSTPSVSLQLENALQSEYAFYVATVQHPDQQQALMGDAQRTSADVRDAVVYDLQAVATQLSQDAAIQSAQQSALAGTGAAPTTLLAPELGTIAQGFGATDFAMEPPFTFGGVTYPHFHTGIDIAAPLDTPVAAAADGVVVIAGSSTDLQGNLIGYGNYIVIAHAGKMVTLYGHLDRLLVHPGQLVRAGDIVGLEGSTGNSTGPHLHFEVRVAGLLANPMQYLGTQLRTQ